MKTTYRHPLEQNDTLKYIALIVGVVIILVLVFCLGGMIRETAAINQAGVEPISTPSKIDYEQLYNESLLEIDALNATIQEITEDNRKLEETNRAYAEREETLTEEILTLEDEAETLENKNQAMEEEIATLKKVYGTSYLVEYEVRKKSVILGGEDIIRFHSIVPKNTYDNTVLNMELAETSEMYSIPSSSPLTTWSIVACNKCPIVDEID